MSIKPERKQEIAQRVAERYAERLKKTLLGVMDEGFLYWQRAKPAQVREALRRETSIEDVPVFLNPKLLRLALDGRIRLTTPRWALMQALPDYVLERFSREFRRFWSEEEAFS